MLSNLFMDEVSIMGGTRGEVRGKSKIETYLNYVEETEPLEDLFTDMYPDPRYKKLCKSYMVWDPDAGEWVLSYHLHT
jgi:hypothetical protein